MKRKKLTNKEITEAIDGLSGNDQYLIDKLLQFDNLFGLYLEYRGDTEKFPKFVNTKAEKEFEQQRSKDKEGA